MRKFLAIFFSLILLFNAGGYRIMLSIQQKKADRCLEAKIDNRYYNEADLIEFKVALNMPYQTRQTKFERQYGEITINNTPYTYVERMVDGDTLILRCIPNEQKQQLNKTADALAKSNSGQQQENNGKSQANPLLKLLGGVYDSNPATIDFSTGRIFLPNNYASYSPSICSGESALPFQPPRQSLLS